MISCPCRAKASQTSLAFSIGRSPRFNHDEKRRRLSPGPAAAEAATVRRCFGFWRSAQDSCRLQAENIIAVARFIEVVAARFDFMTDLMAPNHIRARGFQVLQVKDDIRLMAAEFDANGEASARAFFGGVIDAFIDAPNDIAQQTFLFLKDPFAEHTTSFARAGNAMLRR